MEKRNICIIGYGRFGKLLTEILSPYGRIFVISRSKVRKKGMKQIDYKNLNEMDWVIPAVPISKLEEVLPKINPHLKKGSVVMDVCSVKTLPCQWLKKHVRKDVQILGTHPMFGPDSALNHTVQGSARKKMHDNDYKKKEAQVVFENKWDLKGLQVVICPLRISSANLREIEKVFRSLELKVIKKTPREHDKQAARSLSLVYFLGRALGKMGIGKQEISTLGYKRLLSINETVGNDTWQLFWDMQKYNSYAGKERRKLIKSLQEVNNEIKNGL